MKQTRVVRLIIAYIGFIFLGLPSGIVGVAWPSIRHTFGLPQDSLGILLASIAVGYVLSSFFSGRIGARLGLGPLLMFTVFVSAVGMAGVGLIGSWPDIVVLGVLIGQGTGTLDAGINTSVAMNDGVRAMNWLHASWGLGATLGPILMNAGIASTGSYRAGYLVIGALYVILGAAFAATLNIWLLPSLKSGLKGSGGPIRAVGLRLLRTSVVLYAILVFIVFVGVELTAGQWGYTLLTESRGFGGAAAATCVSLYWGCLTIGRGVLGLIGHRLSPERVLRGCMIDILVGCLLMAFTPSPLSIVGLSLLGLGIGPLFPLLIKLTPDRVGADNASDVIGFQISAATFGGALVPGFAGVLAQHVGLEAIAWLMVVGSAALLWLYDRCVSTARDTRGPDQGQARG